MNKGFIITKLILTGNDLSPAFVEFTPKLNVISGPTNTGKTFILECINFMMGGSDLPRDIGAAKGYDKIFLELITEITTYTLERSKSGGDFKLYKSKFQDIDLTEPELLLSKHSKKNENTVSAFFLKLNNIWNKEIRINNSGKLRTLSYRDICHLLLVSETKITKLESPILYSAGFANKTAETNVVKFLLTGVDDNSIITAPDEKIITSKRGKIELLDELIQNIENTIPQTNDFLEITLDDINHSIENIKLEHNNLLSEFTSLNKERKAISSKLNENEERLKFIEDTLSHSFLLKEHYYSDIKRLKSTIEAGLLLNDNNTENEICPYCENTITKVINVDEIEQTIEACESEINKIDFLLTELEKSIFQIEVDKSNLELEFTKNKVFFLELQNKLSKDVEIQLSQKLDKIEKLNNEKTNLLESQFQEKTIVEFNKYRTEINESLKKPEDKIFDKLTTSTIQPLCDVIKKILLEMSFPNLGTVTFSEGKLDLVISNEDRNLTGKGLRAITFATFILALVEYVNDKDFRIGTPIFDSPLVTYSKPKAEGEGITQDLAMNFFRYCALKSSCPQTIIIENEEPPEDILDNINHIVFTGIVGKGREGFIPTKYLEP